MNNPKTAAPAEQAPSRRAFIQSAAASVAAAASIPAMAATMPTHTLGRTGMKVSRLAQGGSWNVDPEVVGTALQHGVNYIDTAESYNSGQSEAAFGDFLQQIGATGRSARRRDLWLVTKTFDYANLAARLQGSLLRLQQDYVDCLYMHEIQDPKLPLDPGIKAQAAALKRSGKIRFFGFSCHDAPLVACLEAASKSNFIDVVMLRYDCHWYPRADLDRALDLCSKAGIGLVAMKTQVGGMTLPDRFDPFLKRGLNQHQAAIRAVAADGRIAAICSEMTTVEMVRQNAGALLTQVSDAERKAIQEHARLVSHLYCRGCDQICRAKAGAGSQIAVADALRFLMYHDHYRQQERARRLFRQLPLAARSPEALQAGDWHAAEAACPYHIPLTALMQRVRDSLA